VAREAAGGYSADEGGAQDDVRDAARQLRQAAARLVSLATKDGRVEGWRAGGVADHPVALDAAQAAAVELTSHVQVRGSSERSAGLPLEYLLALETRLTGPDRRMLASAAETLRTMPHLARAFQAGHVGWAEVRAIVCEVRSLPADARATIDDGFAIQCNIVGRDADRLLDEVRATADSLRPDKTTRTPPAPSNGGSFTSNPSWVGRVGPATSNSTTKPSPPSPPAWRPRCRPRRPAPTTSPPTPSATPTRRRRMVSR
jgi:hypothetical protein